MLLRVLFLVLMSCNYLQARDSHYDLELGEKVVDAKNCCKGFMDEYCCMVYRVTSKCTKRNTDACCLCTKESLEVLGQCCVDSGNCILDSTLPCRHKEKGARTKCVKNGLSNTSCCLGITGGVGSFLSAIAASICWCACPESWVAQSGYCLCKVCVGTGACSLCLKDDSFCPVAYGCEKCFNLEKLSSFTSNSAERNPEEMERESKDR